MQVTIDLFIEHNRIMKLITICFIVCIVLAVSMYVRTIDGFTGNAKAIPRFSKPVPVIPTRPHPATNSNGGLVRIS